MADTPADKAAAREAEQKSWIDKILSFGRSLLPDLDFGSILMWGLILTGLHFFLNKSETGQQLVQWGLSQLSPDMQANVAGFLDSIGIETDMLKMLSDMPVAKFQSLLITNAGASQEVLNIIAPNDKAKNEFLSIVAKANDGKVSASSFTNDKTLFVLMRDHAPMLQQLVAASLKGNTAKDKLSQTLLESMREIVKDNRLDTLLNPQHRPNTIALLKKFGNIDGKQLNGIIEASMAEGKPTAEFRQFLTTALTPNDKGELPIEDALKAYTSKNPALKKLVNDTITAAPAPDAKPSALEPQELLDFKKDKKNLAALQQLQKNLGDEKFSEFVANLGNETAMLKFAIENRKEVTAFVAALNEQAVPEKLFTAVQLFKTIPPAADKPLLAILGNNVSPRSLLTIFREPNADPKAPLNTRHIVGELLKAENRALITKAGIENVASLIQATGTDVNANKLKAILTATNSIATGKDLTNPNTARDTVAATTAIADLLIKKDPASLKHLNNEQWISFIGDARNSNALKQLLIDLQPELTQTESAKVGIILRHWSLVESLAADKEKGALFLRDRLLEINDKSAVDCKAKQEPGTVNTIRNWLDNAKIDAGLWVAGKDGLSENLVGKLSPEIKAMALEFQAVDCAPAAAAPAPTPRPSEPAPAAARR